MMQKCMVLKPIEQETHLLLRLRMMQKCMVLKLSVALTVLPNEFENDVEMYGAQTIVLMMQQLLQFENDVEMYGAQT